MPRRKVEDLESERYYEDGFTCLLRNRHPLLAGPWTTARFAKAHRVLVTPRGATDRGGRRIPRRAWTVARDRMCRTELRARSAARPRGRPPRDPASRVRELHRPSWIDPRARRPSPFRTSRCVSSGIAPSRTITVSASRERFSTTLRRGRTRRRRRSLVCARNPATDASRWRRRCARAHARCELVRTATRKSRLSTIERTAALAIRRFVPSSLVRVCR